MTRNIKCITPDKISPFSKVETPAQKQSREAAEKEEKRLNFNKRMLAAIQGTPTPAGPVEEIERAKKAEGKVVPKQNLIPEPVGKRRRNVKKTVAKDK